MKLGSWWRAGILALAVPLLGACAGTMPGAAREELIPSTPVLLRSVPRHVLFAPATEWIYLWDRPGGLAARALRIARVPSWTEGVMLAVEPPDPPASDYWAMIGADAHERQPVRWVRVATPQGEGWVRREFVEPK